MLQGIKITDFINRKKNYQTHLNRLQKITQRKTSQPKQQYLENYYLLKERNRRIKTEEYHKSVELGNRKLLDRIVSITTRTCESPSNRPFKSKPHHHSYYSRVKNYDLINHENPNILKRIASQSGCISVEQQQKDYERTRRMKSQLQKFPYTNNIKRKMKAIEAINNTRKLLVSSRIQSSIKFSQNNTMCEEMDQMVI